MKLIKEIEKQFEKYLTLKILMVYMLFMTLILFVMNNILGALLSGLGAAMVNALMQQQKERLYI